MSFVINHLLALPGSTFSCRAADPPSRQVTSMGSSPLCSQKLKPQCPFLSTTYSLCRGPFFCRAADPPSRQVTSMGSSPLCSQKPKPQCPFLSITYSLCRGPLSHAERPTSSRPQVTGMGLSPLCFEKPNPECLFLSITYSLCRVLLFLGALESLFFAPSSAPTSPTDPPPSYPPANSPRLLPPDERQRFHSALLPPIPRAENQVEMQPAVVPRVLAPRPEFPFRGTELVVAARVHRHTTLPGGGLRSGGFERVAPIGRQLGG